MGITEQTQRVISLCTGIRGLERGLERTGIKIRTIANVEIESFICENLAQEMDFGFLDEAPTWSNLKTFDGRKFRGLVDGITGGYPCQPFSAAGKRNGTEDPRHLWPYIGGNENNIIKAVRPVWCFFENVRGHVTLGLREVIASLEGMGYRVHWGIFSAEETGASHKRERVFILAIRRDILENTDSKPSWFNTRGLHGKTPSASSELGYSPELHAQRCNERPWQIQSRRTGDEPTIELANSNDQGQPQQERNIKESGKWVGNGSEQLANSCEYDIQRIEPRIFDKKERSFDIERPSRSQNRIVARPGEVQHGWERPRTISYAEETTEPSLGLSVNGYRFREDFLRALGNSVYEDSAALAFLTLLKKHGLINGL